MRILAALLMTSIFYMIFKILKRLTKETNISVIITALIGLLFREIFCIDYNYMCLFLCLSILYLELASEKKNKSLWIGILGGLAICTKQSIGAIIAIAVLLRPLLEINKKENIKVLMKEVGKRVLGIAIPSIILLSYLIITNSFNDFLDYAIKGIATFDNKVEYKTLLKSNILEITILSRLIPVTIIVTILASIITKIISIKKVEVQEETKEKFTNIQILTLYSLPVLIVIYPIADRIHFLIGITIALISISYCLFLLGKIGYDKIRYSKKKFHYKTITLIIWVGLLATISLQGVINIREYINNYRYGKINKEIEHFENIEIPEYLQDRIIEIDKYIKEKEKQGITVYILDAESAVYTIPLNKYTKDYDMFLKGNIGKDGEQGQIEKIKKEKNENIIYLVRKDNETLNWQSPIKVITYIKENLRHVGEIEFYDAYTE